MSTGSGFARSWLAAAASVVAIVASMPATAQPFPSKPIKLVVTLSPGSAADTLARVVADGLTQQLGQTVVIENRTGGGGTIGANVVAKAEPDGHTLLVNTSLHTLAPALIAQMPYDVMTDFAGVAVLGVSPHVLIIAPSQGIKSINELVAAAKTRPGGLTYAAVVASGTHLNGAHFVKTMNVEGRMVPFKGAPESITEVLTGRVDIYFSPILPALPHLNEGKLLGLGVSSKKRSAALPNVPTTFDSGYPDSEFGLPFYLYAPGKTPRAVVDKLHAETVKLLTTPVMTKKLTELGIDAMQMSPTELDAYTKRQVKVDGEMAAAAGLGKN